MAYNANQHPGRDKVAKVIAEAIRIDVKGQRITITARRWGEDEHLNIPVEIPMPRSVSGRKLVDRAMAAASTEEREIVPSAFLRYGWS